MFKVMLALGLFGVFLLIIRQRSAARAERIEDSGVYTAGTFTQLDVQYLPHAFDAQRHRRQVDMRYRNGDGETSQRVIDVYKVYGNGTFKAWCNARDDLRTFRTDRIMAWNALDSTFNPKQLVTDYLEYGEPVDVSWPEWVRRQGGASEDERNAKQIIDENLPWLNTRWERAAQERSVKNFSTVPKWFFHKATKAQLRRLSRDGVDWPAEELTKGKASDLIGLFNKLDAEDAKVLRFFELPTEGMSQTYGREAVAKLMANPKSRTKWDGRPANKHQKAFFQLFGLEKPRPMKFGPAQQRIDEQMAAWEKTGDPRAEGWDEFEALVEELSDRETRKELELKAVSFKVTLETVCELVAKGQTVLAVCEDIDAFADELLELTPELRRAGSN